MKSPPDILSIYMTQENLIRLKIDRSLSYTIDKQLDSELSQDVKLNENQWQSVFNIIKSDNATKQKQYRGGDEDINSTSNFVVRKGQTYKITQTAWNAIKDIASKALGKTSETEATPTETTTITEENVDNTPEKQVEKILQNNNIDTSDINIDDVVNKYKTIVKYNEENNITTDESVLETRILNYAKGLKYEAAEAGFAALYANDTETSDKKYEIAGVKEAIESYDGTEESLNNAIKKQNEAFHQAGKEKIELYDLNGDGKISIEEFLTKSIADEEKRLGRALTAEEKNIVFNQMASRIGVLDQNSDDLIDQNEMAAFVWATAKINDTETHKSANDITYNEWKTSEEIITLAGDINNLSQDEANKIDNFLQILENGYNGLKRE